MMRCLDWMDNHWVHVGVVAQDPNLYLVRIALIGLGRGDPTGRLAIPSQGLPVRRAIH